MLTPGQSYVIRVSPHSAQQPQAVDEPQSSPAPGKPANLTIKLPSKELRDYWIAQARLQGTNVTRLVVEYLESRLGKP